MLPRLLATCLSCSIIALGLGGCDDDPSSTPSTTSTSISGGGGAGLEGGQGGTGATAQGGGGGTVEALGPLTVHGTNPRYFADDDGNALWLAGSHTWYNIHSSAVDPEMSDDDFAVFLDFAQSHGHNFVRLWTGFSYLGYEPHPWLRPGPELANDGEPQFDMRSKNQDYYDLVRRRVEMLRARGMYCSLMFFGSHNRMKSDFAQVAWHPDNNTNDELAAAFDGSDGYSFFTDDEAALEIQRLMVHHFIDELGDLDNILWEIINEPGGSAAAVAWHHAMVDYALAYQADQPLQHLVGMTGGWQLGTEMLSSDAAWISPDWDAYLEGGPADYDAKIVINDTDHLPGWGYSDLVDADDMRRWVWKTFTRGHHAIFMDSYNANLPDHDNFGEVNHAFDAVRDAMGLAVDYSRRFPNLAAMVPSQSTSSTGYSLEEPGRAYLVYQPADGEEFTVELTAGSYDYEWLDASTGTVAETGSVTASSTQSFTPPVNADAVLYLRQ